LLQIIERHYVTDEGVLAKSVPLEGDNPIEYREFFAL